MIPSQPSLSQSLRALPREAWLLYLGTFLNRFGSFVIPFLAIYAGDHFRAMGYSDEDATEAAAWTLTAYGLGHFVAALAGGYLADRIGRWPSPSGRPRACACTPGRRCCCGARAVCWA